MPQGTRLKQAAVTELKDGFSILRYVVRMTGMGQTGVGNAQLVTWLCLGAVLPEQVCHMMRRPPAA